MSNMQISGIASSYNATPNNYYDVPTNAKLTLGSYATDDKLFTIIYEDGSISNDTIERPTMFGSNLNKGLPTLSQADGGDGNTPLIVTDAQYGVQTWTPSTD